MLVLPIPVQNGVGPSKVKVFYSAVSTEEQRRGQLDL
jgi:hypothetical protein